MATVTKTASNDFANKGGDVSVQDLSAQIETLKADLAKLTSSVSSYGQAKAYEAKDTAQKRASELTEAGMNKAYETQKQAEDFVRTQPAAAIGIAAGIGFLIGIVSARR